MVYVARFLVRGQAEPQTLPRLVNYFAQIGETPLSLYAKVEEETIEILIEQPRISDRQAGIIAEKMRSLVSVDSVHLTLRANHHK